MKENELIAKINKLIKKAEKPVSDKYRGIFYFMESLEANNVDVFELLRKEWSEGINRK
jgi:hypothetical protein